MDRAIFSALSGAQHILEQQATTVHNLANGSSTGFKRQIESFLTVPVTGSGLQSRALVANAVTTDDFAEGSIKETGRTLDIAIQGKGWFAVRRSDGTEAYTRNGSFRLDQNGFLQTTAGLAVIGDSGPITIPPGSLISIASDGSISTMIDGVSPGSSNALDRLKLINVADELLTRTEEGLYVTKNGLPVGASNDVSVVSGALEGSNVNVITEMVNMIALSRQFDVQMKVITMLETSDSQASSLYKLS